MAYGALGLVWGANFIFTKRVIVTITPQQIALLRGLFGFLALLVFALAKGALRWRDWCYAHHFFVMSALATAFYYLAQELRIRHLGR